MSTSKHQILGTGLLATAIAGCGGSGGGESQTAPGAAVTYHKDVAPILADRCVGCHTEGGIAPFSLERFEDVSAVRGAVREAVVTRTMPPWLAGQGCNDYTGDPSLGDDQIAAIAAWVDAGGPEGDPADAPHDDTPEAPTLSRVDRTLSMTEAYTPVGADDYRCFLLDWPEDAPSYVTGFRANPGDATTVHHVIAFLVSPDQAAAFDALDQNEAGPGYTCFGGPGNGNDPGTAWIGAWAPGSAGGDLPAGTGIEVLPGSKIALQVHYNTAHGDPGPDMTSIDVKLDAAVEKEAHWQFWADPVWVYGGGMDIPMGDADVTHAFSSDPTGYMSGGKPMTIHSTALHMHTRGTKATLGVKRAAGAEECLLDIPRWDFHWQLNYALEQPVHVAPGDELSIACHWDNSAGTKDLAWGEGTGDEMCLGAVYVTAD